MNDFSFSGDFSLRRDRALRAVLAGWTLAALVILAQGVAEQAIDQGTVTLEFLLRWRLYPVALWAAATPPLLAAAARWPVRGARWPGHVLVHGALFAAWMVLSNALLRIPDLLAGDTAGLAHETLAAAIEYAPAGALLWTLLVALGRGRGGAETQAGPGPDEGGAPAGRTAPAAGAAVTPLSLRQGERTYLVPREAVRWVEADGDYLQVHGEERSYRIRGPLKDFHRELGSSRFLRIHRSTLVNVRFIREVQPYFHGDYVAILRDGTQLRIPRTRRSVIERLRGASRQS